MNLQYVVVKPEAGVQVGVEELVVVVIDAVLAATVAQPARRNPAA